MRKIFLYISMTLASSCAFNFEVTSQRTALENQILGSYEELESDVVMVSSVRSLDETGKNKEVDLSELQEQAVKARQNQDFNRDDLDELKASELIGESNDGTVVLLPEGTGKYKDHSEEDINFAKSLCEEENKDRKIIWGRIIQSNENLSENNLNEVRQTFAKMQREQAQKGHWIQEQDGRWIQKQ